MLTETLPILSLQLQDQRDSSCIAIADSSTYAVLPDSTTLAMQITPPGYDTINVPFSPLMVNVYKCVDLGITCSDTGCTALPDGIYDVIYSVVTTNNVTASINQKFIKIDTIKCKYEHMFLKLNVEYSCHDTTGHKFLEELKRAKLYIDGSVVACNNNNYVLSNDLYNKALYILNNLCCKFKSINWKSNCNSGAGYGYGSIGGLIGCGC